MDDQAKAAYAERLGELSASIEGCKESSQEAIEKRARLAREAIDAGMTVTAVADAARVTRPTILNQLEKYATA